MLSQNLSTRYGMVLALITGIVGVCLLGIGLYQFDRFVSYSVEESQEQLQQVLNAQLERDARLVAKTVASGLDLPVYAQDFSDIRERLESLKAYGRVSYIYIYDTQGKIIHDGSQTVALYNKSVADYLPNGLSPTLDEGLVRMGSDIHIVQPIISGGVAFAALRFCISYDEANQDVYRVGQELFASHTDQRNKSLISHIAAFSILMLLAVFIVFYMSRRLLAPIRELAMKCRRYGGGEMDVDFYAGRDDELGLLGDALNDMKRDIDESRKQIEKLAYLDALTELPNRRFFDEQVKKLLSWAEANDSSIALLFIDLDHFKEVNDVAGHRLGDKLLQRVASRLQHIILNVAPNIPLPVSPEHLLARFGGDEFVMLLPGLDNIEQIAGVARRVERLLDDTYLIESHRFKISASIGVALYPDDGTTFTEMLKNADIAMYAAKHSGRNRFRFFEHSMNTSLVDQVEMIQGVRDALHRQHFELYYQPIYDLKDNSLVGAEALLRWKRPKKGIITPGSFMPLVETSELVVPVSLWVLDRACQDLKRLFLPCKPDFKLSVNISGSIMNDHEVCDEISTMIERAGIPRNRLHIEITETSMMENIQQCSTVLGRWKEAGADIWVDDFGTGYSSLSYLHTLPIDGLKVDQSFVHDIKSDAAHKLVEAILAMSQSLGLETVAEGIENKEQRDILDGLGASYGQGYLFSKPTPVTELVKKLESQLARKVQKKRSLNQSVQAKLIKAHHRQKAAEIKGAVPVAKSAASKRAEAQMTPEQTAKAVANARAAAAKKAKAAALAKKAAAVAPSSAEGQKARPQASASKPAPKPETPENSKPAASGNKEPTAPENKKPS
ncbi:MAG: EAL domain-containing protein [Pontibacterium sp.]